MFNCTACLTDVTKLNTYICHKHAMHSDTTQS